jgi:voltage-gated potassium channel
MERKVSRRTVRRTWQVILSGTLIGLIALSVAATEGILAAVVVLSILAIVTIFRTVFQSGRAFCITLANLVGVYACLFQFFVESNFRTAAPWALSVGFVLPLIGFLAGSLRHRSVIKRLALSQKLSQDRILQVLAWLAPVFGVGALTFLLPRFESSQALVNGALLAACGAIGLIVFGVSRDIALFLRETGLLFDEFFRRCAALLVPAFAFLSFYSLLVILFATLYAVLDQATGGTNFRIDGIVRAITFPESLYFSLMTLSTVGYGDIAPATSGIRVIAAAEIVSGILLLLFGFNEIFSFARRREQLRQRRSSEEGGTLDT